MNDSLAPEMPFADDHELAEAALEGDPVAIEVLEGILFSPNLKATLIRRGASASEAEEIIADLAGDCFGGERSSGDLHRLLERFGGTGSLAGFLGRTSLNRLISLKRRQKPTVRAEDSASEEGGVVLVADQVVESEDAVLDLLRSAITGAFASVDQENLVLFRLVKSYQISQKRVAEMWNLSESKICRILGFLVEELKEKIIGEIRQRDPWLYLEWEDFTNLCGESVDLFDY